MFIRKALIHSKLKVEVTEFMTKEGMTLWSSTLSLVAREGFRYGLFYIPPAFGLCFISGKRDRGILTQFTIKRLSSDCIPPELYSALQLAAAERNSIIVEKPQFGWKILNPETGPPPADTC